jgi:hypothetical protein
MILTKSRRCICIPQSAGPRQPLLTLQLQQGWEVSEIGSETTVQGQQSPAADVAFGSRTAAAVTSWRVRFTPNRDPVSGGNKRRFGPKAVTLSVLSLLR